jgi:hypothetical protein
MTEVIVFPDTDAVVVQWLSQQMPEVRVSTKRVGGAEDQTEQITVTTTATSGFVNMVTDEVVVILRSYAKDEGAAANLCQLARAFTKALAQQDSAEIEVYEIRGDTSVYRFNDPDANIPSYQCSVQLLIGYEFITETRSLVK